MSNEDLAAANGIFATGMAIVLLIVLVLWALFAIAHWRMFTKAGEKGWKSLIPIYSDYTLFKLVWNIKSFWILVVLWVVMAVSNAFSGQYTVVDGQLVFIDAGNIFVNIIGYVSSVGIVLYTVLLGIKTSLAYGKGMVFSLGLVLLPNIFSLILAFGSAKYIGASE